MKVTGQEVDQVCPELGSDRSVDRSESMAEWHDL